MHAIVDALFLHQLFHHALQTQRQKYDLRTHHGYPLQTILGKQVLEGQFQLRLTLVLILQSEKINLQSGDTCDVRKYALRHLHDRRDPP